MSLLVKRKRNRNHNSIGLFARPILCLNFKRLFRGSFQWIHFLINLLRFFSR